MLVTSENLFFGDARAIVANKKSAGPNNTKNVQSNIFTRPLAAVQLSICKLWKSR